MFPTGGSKTDLSASGPQKAYLDPSGKFVQQTIGPVPTPPGTIRTLDQAEIDKAIADSQHGQVVQINLPWLLSQPDSPSKQGLIDIVAALNKAVGGK